MFGILELIQPVIRESCLHVCPICVGEDASEGLFMGLARAVKGGVGTGGQSRQRAFGNQGGHVSRRGRATLEGAEAIAARSLRLCD
jgi:hypothetical protein